MNSKIIFVPITSTIRKLLQPKAGTRNDFIFALCKLELEKFVTAKKIEITI